jgi:hypothetical protein
MVSNELHGTGDSHVVKLCYIGLDYVTPEILEDIARLMFLSVVEMAR